MSGLIRRVLPEYEGPGKGGGDRVGVGGQGSSEPIGCQCEEICQVTLSTGQQPPQFVGRQVDGRAVVPIDVDGQPDHVATAFGVRAGAVPEPRPA